MNKLHKKSLRGYLTSVDEAVVSARLRELIPEIRFVDGQIWENENPPLKPRIEDCSSDLIYFFDNAISDGKFVSRIIEGGKYRGSVYHSIQLMRSYVWEGAFMNFELSICYESDELMMDAFVKKTWKAFKTFPVVTLKYVDGVSLKTLSPSSKAQIVGTDAAARCAEGLKLKHNRDHKFWAIEESAHKPTNSLGCATLF